MFHIVIENGLINGGLTVLEGAGLVFILIVFAAAAITALQNHGARW